MPEENVFDHWRYWSHERGAFWPLPPWSHFMMSLGASVARLSEEIGPTLTAVSVPSRGYCAALVTVGFLLARSERGDDLDSDHVAFLRSLEKGRNVWCFSDSKTKEAVFEGIVVEGGNESIRLTVGKGKNGYIHKIPVKDASRVQLASKDREVKRATVRARVAASEFAVEAFAKQTGNRFAIQSHVDAVIVGRKNILVQELVEQEFGIVTADGVKSGYLQEVVRAINLGLIPDAQGFSTSVESPYEELQHARGKPLVAVFDGMAAFSRNRKPEVSVPHWIVFLDRTERKYEEGCQLVDGSYLGRKAEVPRKLLPPPVSGVELVSFVRPNR